MYLVQPVKSSFQSVVFYAICLTSISNVSSCFCKDFNKKKILWQKLRAKKYERAVWLCLMKHFILIELDGLYKSHSRKLHPDSLVFTEKNLPSQQDDNAFCQVQ